MKISFPSHSLHFIGLATALYFAPCAESADTGFSTKETPHGVDVLINGEPFASYVIDQANKPYLWPVYGPTGKAMTRAYPMQELPEEPKAQRDHPHHRGITFGHEDAAGSATWPERLTYEKAVKNGDELKPEDPHVAKLGRIQHVSFTLKADAEHAVIEEHCDHVDSAGKRLFTEDRRLTFRTTASTRSIDFDQDFHATEGEVRFEDRKDAGLSIRVPSSMAVDTPSGGHIINSNKVMDKDAWAKSAKWCDYYGPVEGEVLGIAFFNHPSSYRYPTPWHVRTYGLFTANPFGSKSLDKTLPEAPTVIAAGGTLKLRHRFVFHKGDAESAHVEEAFTAYAAETR
jgi:hypothetical protein